MESDDVALIESGTVAVLMINVTFFCCATRTEGENNPTATRATSIRSSVLFI
jgi:hypothetical protein